MQLCVRGNYEQQVIRPHEGRKNTPGLVNLFRYRQVSLHTHTQLQFLNSAHTRLKSYFPTHTLPNTSF